MAKDALHRKERYFADKYAVVRVLGKGGMGTIYEARHTRLGHRVAIKVLDQSLREHPELVERFEREARSASALSSPRAAKIFDVDQTNDGVPYMVMELLEGRDLGRIIAREGRQPVGRAVRWIIEACHAIGEAHELGIIHRDIKPSNLFLCAETGSVKVLDFGIAKRLTYNEAALTGEFVPLGTPQYMSPEQVRCATDLDARSDIWSLGVTLYELLCGRPPFDHEVAQACIVSIAMDPVPEPRTFCPDLPEELCAVLMRALEKDPTQRFSSIDEFVDALRPFADEVSAEEEAWLASPDRHSITRQRVADESCGGSESSVIALERRVPPRRRFRAKLPLAMAMAMAVGLVLAVVPKRVGARMDDKAPIGIVASVATDVSRVASDESQPSEEAPAIAIGTVVRHPASAKPVERAERKPQASRNTLAPRVTSVHGGLSSPGF